ncbi:hypothetical protein FOZ63_030007 [Perkinsus olseni]|uniref:Uncharacterized protein n=1 Tax=Perkinsus olseni TaxID=32597 RepID=A0A7J6RGP1_PEROL|nr:hypothetical protein FOZ63_030007 [Perkinsus olseni]
MILSQLLLVWLSIFYTPVALTSARKREWANRRLGLEEGNAFAVLDRTKAAIIGFNYCGSLTVSKLDDQKCRISQADFHWLYYIADNHVYTNSLSCTDENHRDFHFEL